MRIGRFTLPLAVLLTCAWAAGAQPSAGTKTYQVPYRLTDTLHVLVRVKINGKGPFNLILDTGAPLLYLTKETGTRIGLQADGKGWATLERLEIEGGPSEQQVKCRVESLFQLDRMNTAGLAGTELHGILGYSLLARYRTEFDFTRDRMTWTRLDFTPALPEAVAGKVIAPGGLAVGGKGDPLGERPGAKVTEDAPRGFLGIELAEKAGVVTARAVLAGSPAAAAGLRAGDHVRQVQGRDIRSIADVRRWVGQLSAGRTVRFTVLRGAQKQEIAVTVGEGL